MYYRVRPSTHHATPMLHLFGDKSCASPHAPILIPTAGRYHSQNLLGSPALTCLMPFTPTMASYRDSEATHPTRAGFDPRVAHTLTRFLNLTTSLVARTLSVEADLASMQYEPFPHNLSYLVTCIMNRSPPQGFNSAF